MNELCDEDAVTLRRLIGAKEISPIEVLDSCLDRIDKTNQTVNAVIALDRDGARDAARSAERAVLRGEDLPVLHGLPIGIKDLSATMGLKTTFGSLLFADHVPTGDDSVVARVRQAGGIILAKTNTPEFGAGANTRNLLVGATGNPLAPSLTCGGSSGGSAVALACGMVPLATGSDMGGSLRTPAGFCGIVGFRPTPGLVPSDRRLAGWSPLAVEGPMARSVADLGLLLQAMASDDPADPLSGPLDPAGFQTLPEIDLSRLTIAVSEDLGFAPVSEAIRRVFRQRCGSFADLFKESIERDPDFAGADRIFSVLRAESFLANPVFKTGSERLAPPVKANIDEAQRYTLQDRATAASDQMRLYQIFQRFFRDVDLLICPAATISPFPHDIWAPEAIDGIAMTSYYHWIAITYGLSLTGHPVVCLACGVDERGLPFGIQIVGKRRSDRFVLGAALALERAFSRRHGLGRAMPDIAALAGDGTAASR